MNPNVGGLDRIVRIIVGLAVIAAGFYYQSWWGAIGLIPLVTALIRWCPAYSITGCSTANKSCCGHNKAESEE